MYLFLSFLRASSLKQGKLVPIIRETRVQIASQYGRTARKPRTTSSENRLKGADSEPPGNVDIGELSKK